MIHLKRYTYVIVLIVISLLLTLSCASRQYAPKSPRRTHRCGDCPKFSQTENNMYGADNTERKNSRLL